MSTGEKDAQYWIDQLELSPHPEGGYYRATYKSDVVIAQSALPKRFGGERSASTAIYFLLAGKEFSALHRIAADEVWHFYGGSSLVVSVIDTEGNYSELHLGNRPEAGESFQGVVTAGCWFGARLKNESGFALVGCTVAPGFEFADFELGNRAELVRTYPQHRKLIEDLTRL
ncbi:MAG TPA: cupin domain-containing protein [Acidobacteriaceae bacterium]|nr:cupin domain-containing protein [Acidobacteriaceae bacterium]